MSEPNMTLDGLDEWTDSEAFEAYAKYHEENVEPEGHDSVDRVVERARDVIRNGEESPHYDKVTNYVKRAKSAYKRTGAGSRKFDGVAKNVAALRNWGYDPHGTYT